MAFTANDYIEHAAELYGDTELVDDDYVRVKKASWIKHLNAAVRALILVRPDAGSTTQPVQLVAGILQSKPSVALRILDITRNLGTDGATPGKIITPSDRKHIDFANMMWPADTGLAYVDNFSYDANAPDVFYVTPPVSSTTNVYVEMIYSVLPTAVSAVGDSVGINDIFFEPVVQYMLYKAYSVDDEDVEFGKAVQYLQTFFNLLQVEFTAAVTAGPESKE